MKRVFLLLPARHVGICLLLLLGAGVALAEADEFYLNRLRSGQEALRQRRTAAAADELRVACFGLMESPPLLMECLISLANAQSGAGRDEDLVLTLARVLEVEGKFQVYGALNIDPTFRAEFEGQLVKRLSREALSSVPEFARLAAPEKTEKTEKAEKGKAAGKSATVAPVAAPVAAPAAPTEVVAAPVVAPAAVAESSVEPAPTASPVPSPARPQEDAEAATLATARQLVAERRYGEASALLEAALAKSPGSRTLRKQHLETLVLQKLWAAAAVDAKALGPFQDGEETSMFYAAVALWEMGLREQAKPLMEKAITRVAGSPFVDYYVTRITGRPR